MITTDQDEIAAILDDFFELQDGLFCYCMQGFHVVEMTAVHYCDADNNDALALIVDVYTFDDTGGKDGPGICNLSYMCEGVPDYEEYNRVQRTAFINDDSHIAHAYFTAQIAHLQGF